MKNAITKTSGAEVVNMTQDSLSKIDGTQPVFGKAFVQDILNQTNKPGVLQRFFPSQLDKVRQNGQISYMQEMTDDAVQNFRIMTEYRRGMMQEVLEAKLQQVKAEVGIRIKEFQVMRYRDFINSIMSEMAAQDTQMEKEFHRVNTLEVKAIKDMAMARFEKILEQSNAFISNKLDEAEEKLQTIQLGS